MSTLRISNIEAKADISNPDVNEKVKITNSSGRVLVQVDGSNAGITSVGINTTSTSFTFDAQQNVQFVGDIKVNSISPLVGVSTVTFGSDINVTGSINGYGRMILETAKTATGTAVDFTGIPSWVKRVTVILAGVSTNGSSGIRFRLGSGSIQTTGYNNRYTLGTTGWNSVSSSTGGFDFTFGGASYFADGSIVLHNPSGAAWIATGFFTSNFPAIIWTGGNTGLSGTLDRIRITTVNGTDTFDAGSINLLLEGY